MYQIWIFKNYKIVEDQYILKIFKYIRGTSIQDERDNVFLRSLSSKSHMSLDLQSNLFGKKP